LKDDRDRRRRRLGCQGRWQTPERNHSDLTLNQLGSQRRQSIVLAVRPAILELHVLAVDVAGFVQPLAKRTQLVLIPNGRRAPEVTDNGHTDLLRARDKRKSRRTAEQADQATPVHARS
jgi:hypothetical protein